MKLISVIIPIFNTEEFLKECLDSVIEQTYKNIEIILINDGSTDGSADIIEHYCKSDSRVKGFHLNKQYGVGYARNIGLQNASGDYIFFLDSDDFIDIHLLEHLFNHIDQEDLIVGEYEKIDKSRESMIQHSEKKNISKGWINRNELSSVTNVLIKTNVIKTNHLNFMENVKIFSDLSFLLPLLENIETVSQIKGCVYYRRERNDPISNPSLSQLENVTIVRSFLQLFVSMKPLLQESKVGNALLDNYFLNLYKRRMKHPFMTNEDLIQIKELLLKSASLVDKKSLHSVNFFIKREINLLKLQQWNKYVKTTRFREMLRKLKNSFTGKTKFYLFLYHQVFQKMSLKEQLIVFESFLGKNYSDSPKNIYEQLLKEKRDLKYVWIFNEPGKEIPGPAIQVKRFSLRYYYYLARAKYWVSNSRLPKSLTKRKGNIYLQTWHGTPLKRLVFDMKDIYSANPKYKADFYQQSRRWDYLISANKYSSEIFRRAFKFEKEMIEVGYPRNDILYSKDMEIKSMNIKRSLNIPLDKKVILYAPTWRDDDFYAPGKYKFQLKLNLNKMKETLGKDYVILLRMHYFIADHIDTTGVEGFAYNLSHYDDIAELYLISDILITDYSSVFFDYANLKRPILFYTYDLEKYRDQLRGFYIDIENEVPGPLLKTTEEVIHAIEHIDEVNQQYKEKYTLFHNKFCAWDDGNASERVCSIVFRN